MKALKWLLLLVLALAAVVLIGGLFVSPKVQVVRSILVQAPPDKVYALVASPRRWTDWSVWHLRDPAMQIDYTGPESGLGAGWSWRSQSEGSGHARFTAAEPPQRLTYELVFVDVDTTSTGAFSFVPEAGGTRVTWTMDGDFGSNPLMRWFALFADRMIGKDFEGGLGNLKAVVEKGGAK